VSYLGSDWFYPVFDPSRIAGTDQWRFGYLFAWDGVAVTVERDPTLSRCQMRIALSTDSTETKEIDAWNFFNHTWVDRIGTAPLDLLAATVIEKRRPGQPCGVGADTVVLIRYLKGPRGRTAMYSFPSEDFWDFWGGCTVAFTWLDPNRDPDWSQWAPSGAQTPPPTYPIVPLPDGTVMMDPLGGVSRIVFGGTDFRIDDSVTIKGVSYLDYVYAFVTDPINPPAPFTELPFYPVDGTLVREYDRPEVYVVYGGAKFWIPDPPSLLGLGFDWSHVRVIPPNGTAKLRPKPMDGALLTERHDQRVYLVDNGKLRWVKSPAVMEARCLPWRYVRTVPDNALAALPRGPDLDIVERLNTGRAISEVSQARPFWRP
jgi:hypothetical protein